MPTVVILHDNDTWLQPFREACAKRNIQIESWNMMDLDVDLTAPPSHPKDTLYFNRVSPSSHTRGARFSLEHASVVVKYLEHHGRLVLNGSSALGLEISKCHQELALQRFNISSPKTLAAFSPKDIIGAVHKLGASTFLLKHNRGGSGSGVRLFNSVLSATDYVESAAFQNPIDGITLVQEYIESPDQCLYRLEFVGGRHMYSVRVDTSSVVPDAKINNCPADSCALDAAPRTDDAAPGEEEEHGSLSNCPMTAPVAKFQIAQDFQHPIIAQLERLVVAYSVDVCGIEVVLNRTGEAFVIDMNMLNSNYNAQAERLAGVVSGCDTVAQLFAKKLAPLGPGRAADLLPNSQVGF
jgi:hypothetical protein